MVPLISSARYNITAFGLERLHPFDSRKYRRIHNWRLRQGLRKPAEFVRPRPVNHHEVLRVHTGE
jgi:histone deacetylase 11